ncbi:MAG TPA: S46 family peptidase [Bacteroidales bacterium]|nr:S46 family peptidase [Bacteroidales bacterium]
MKLRLLALLLVSIVISPLASFADEGMWLPMLISKYNYADMQKLGLKLTPEQIYSVNQDCLKDAIVALDHGGCTGSVISAKGLLITNHHCGFDAIAKQSSVDHDYLTDGFWAMRPEEELPLPGKTVSFLIRMEDVTQAVLAGIADTLNEEGRAEKIQAATDSITTSVKGDTGFEVSIESMFAGNEYYLFVYQTFSDIRMVGAPPSGIGKFGGETDNWMWPRHTGDFCLLRVYSAADGNPAKYAKENIPLSPKKFLSISLAGVHEGDFAMILGYPGSTDRFLTSYGINQKLEQLNPSDILLKTVKMDIMKRYMNQSDALRIAYAGDYAYLANFQKKSIQESKALTRLNVYDDKKKLEDEFEAWVNLDSKRIEKYGKVLSSLKNIYDQKMADRADEAQNYIMETVMGVQVLNFAYGANEFATVLAENDSVAEAVADFRGRAKEFYQNYDLRVDREILLKMLTLYFKNLPEEYRPEIFDLIKKKFDNDINRYADYLYSKSLFATPEKFEAFLSNPSLKKLEKDPAFKAVNQIVASYILTRFIQMSYDEDFSKARRLFIAGLQEMNPGKAYYPDANSTMRLTYGQVKSYEPADAVEYDYQTTGLGIIQKDDQSNDEFRVPAKLKELFDAKDFGRYAEIGVLPVCFLTTHDITGGNSGSPVMNAKGELIGVAFDGNSEAMSSDIKYDVNLQHTIAVDIRYVLFVIDKYAGASYLVDEMQIGGNGN